VTAKPAASGVNEYFLPVNVRPAEAIRAWEQQYSSRADDPEAATLAYEPVLLAQVSVRYDDRKSSIRHEQDFAFHIRDLDASGFIEWDEYRAAPVDRRDFDSSPRPGAIFGEVPVALNDAKRLKALEDDLIDALYRNYPLQTRYHPGFNIYAHPAEEPGAFEARLRQAAREARDAEVDSATEKMEKTLDRLEDRRKKKLLDLQKEEAKVSGGTQQQVTALAEGVLGLLSGRRTTSALSKIGRATSRKGEIQARVGALETEVQDIEQKIAQLRADYEQELAAIQEKWDAAVERVEPYEITPLKKDIQVAVFGLGWVPYWGFMAGGRFELAPAFHKAG